jgi:hypothetical protein
MDPVLNAAGESADVVIVDAPPLASGADPLVLAARSDVTLLCLRQGRALMRATGAAVETLNGAGAPRVFGVLTVASDRDGDGRGYSYRGAYAYQRGSHDANGYVANGGRLMPKDLVVLNAFPAEPASVSHRSNGHEGAGVEPDFEWWPRRWSALWGKGRP